MRAPFKNSISSAGFTDQPLRGDDARLVGVDRISRDRLVVGGAGSALLDPNTDSFLEENIFEWKDGRPQLYLNLIHRKLPGLYVLGFAEFADGAYRRFEEMAQMIVADIHARESGVQRGLLDRLRENHFPDLRGGKAYIESPRHAAYVDKDTYRDVLMSILRDLGWPAPTDRSFEAMKVDGAVTTDAVTGPATRAHAREGVGSGAEGDRDRPLERQRQA